MKKIAFLILIAVAMMSCDKISDAPVAEREKLEQSAGMEMSADATSEKDSDDGTKGNPDMADDDNNPDDGKFDVDGNSQF